MDVVFQLCQFISVELAPAVVAASKILTDYTANSWGEMHPALREHADADFIRTTFSLDGIKGLTTLRANYITEACLIALNERTTMESAQLRELVSKHESVIHQMDACCGIGSAEADSLTSAYGTAFTSLLSRRTFQLQEVMEDTNTSSNGKQEASTAAQAGTSSTTPKVQGQSHRSSSASSANRVLSLANISCLSGDNTQIQTDGADANANLWPTTESLHAFRLHLATDMMLKSRQTDFYSEL